MSVSLKDHTLRWGLIFCHWLFYCRSSGRSLQSDLPSVPGPFDPEEITLPHSDPIPPSQVELTKPSIEVQISNTIIT